MLDKFILAHVREDKAGEAIPHPLDVHLAGVADLAGQYATEFDSAEWGRLAGLWHDLGKYQSEWQRRLREVHEQGNGEKIGIAHAPLGAVHAARLGKMGRFTAMAIDGHHGGLRDWEDEFFKEREESYGAALTEILDAVPPTVRDVPLPAVPSWLKPESTDIETQKRTKLRRELWLRFLFSALVDADWLNTEEAMEPGKRKARDTLGELSALRDRLDAYIDKLAAKPHPSDVDRVRADILAACRKHAEDPPGVFSLTVPTGGGKTLASMSFALRHAAKYKKRGVVVVLPYTSIIEQNAKVYREALGADNVLEHHSNLDAEAAKDGEAFTQQHALAAENWDMPVVVTTTVQLFESLFANRRGRCRKLHNIANSVIILDEVQTLPYKFLIPILTVLNDLAAHCNCTIVLSTATPPALKQRPNLHEGFKHIVPIIEEPGEFAKALERVRFEWHEEEEPLPLPDLAKQLAQEPRVLAVVDRRQDARELAEHLQAETGEPVFHLSARMCPAHRKERIEEIKAALDTSGAVCRVVSTQLVEAGVDLDFPVVYRALAGLDSIVQAAGRCNREGKLGPRGGRVVVFNPESKPPPGVLRKAAEVTQRMKCGFGEIDFTDMAVMEAFFLGLYHTGEIHDGGIQARRQAMQYQQVAERVRLIDDENQQSLIVPWGKGEKLLERLSRGEDSRELRRDLQPYCVSTYRARFKAWRADGVVYQPQPELDLWAIDGKRFPHAYDDQWGLREGEELQADPRGHCV